MIGSIKAIVLVLVVLAAAPAGAATLRFEPTVDSKGVTLGDLFVGAGHKADRVVAAAPPLGQRVVYTARDLLALAQQHGINWRPRGYGDDVVVTRATQTVSLSDVEPLLTAALQDRVPGGELDVRIYQRSLDLLLPGEEQAGIGIENLIFIPYQNRFSAQVVASAGNRVERRVLSGTISVTARLPVLVRSVNPGETIGARDVGWQQFPYDNRHGDLILDEADLIGKTPRHRVAINRPLRTRDVHRPYLIEKGSLVSIVLRTARMSMSTRGKALDDGARGDVIRVANARSNKIIEGVVTGSDTVDVSPPTAFMN